jgi:hypothetical protein
MQIDTSDTAKAADAARLAILVAEIVSLAAEAARQRHRADRAERATVTAIEGLGCGTWGAVCAVDDMADELCAQLDHTVRDDLDPVLWTDADPETVDDPDVLIDALRRARYLADALAAGTPLGTALWPIIAPYRPDGSTGHTAPNTARSCATATRLR